MEYKWTVLSNTTIGILMSSLDTNIVLISLPTIATQLRGISTLDVLWIILGYQLVIASVLVNFGRLADMFGRVRLYNLGFAIFTIGSGLCSISGNAVELIGFRLIQAVGAGFLFSNSAAIITDAFSPDERGRALGINQVSIVVGSVAGLILGGILTTTLGWRSIFWVNLPIGAFATTWAYFKLKELSSPPRIKALDIYGNVIFVSALVILLFAVTTEAIEGLASTVLYSLLSISLVLFIAFYFVEKKVHDPMFDLSLFKNRDFDAGNITIFLNSLSRGSFILVMVFFLQGPAFGYTPLQAGIFLIPLSLSLSIMGPISGILSDRYGHRPFVITGLLLSAIGFFIMTRIGTSISFTVTLAPLILIGAGMGLFASPNRASIMNSVPGPRRGVASGISTTLVNVGNTVSIGVAFLIMSSNTPRSILDSIFSGLSIKDTSFSIISFVNSLHLVFYASMTMLLVSVLFYTFGLSRKKKDKREPPNLD